MKQFCLNQNVNLRKGGRNAVKMSMEAFKEKVAQLEEKYPEDGAYWMMYVPSVEKDIKVNFDYENFETYYHMSDTGVPYIVVRAGGDWQLPVYCMIYWDGSNLRGYVPTKGNLFNRITKNAIGEDELDDYNFLCKEFGKKTVHNVIIADEGYIDPDEMPDYIGAFKKYLIEDEDSCIEDFESRITVVK